MYIYIQNMKMITKKYNSLLFLLITLIVNTYTFNQSLCKTFFFDGMYYNINTNYSNANRVEGDIMYNYCHQIQIYCESNQLVIYGSLIQKNSTGCYVYNQDSIGLFDEKNISRGINVSYVRQEGNINETIIKSFECRQEGDVGCPDVQYSTIFTFLKNRQLGFTITIQIIGIIFMTLGLYIYRATIVLLGACTMFFILLAIQAPIIFYPGVPHEFLSNLLILTGICSFFAGYVFGYFPKVGIFIQGCWIGLIISLTLNNVAFYYIKSNPANLTLWIVMPILCVLFGVLTLFIKKTFIIFATSLIGAYMSLRALSWYLGAFPNQFLLARRYHLGLVGTVTWQFYLYVVSLVILTASASALQYWLFTKRSEITKCQDIDEQFENMQAAINQKRQNMTNIQLDNFKQIFKKDKSKRKPKILKRNKSDQYDDNNQEQQEEDGKDLSHMQEQPSEQRPAISKKQLTKRYIIK